MVVFRKLFLPDKMDKASRHLSASKQGNFLEILKVFSMLVYKRLRAFPRILLKNIRQVEYFDLQTLNRINGALFQTFLFNYFRNVMMNYEYLVVWEMVH